MWSWESGEYPASFMARVLAWHEAHQMVKLHSEAAVNAALERKTRRRRAGR